MSCISVYDDTVVRNGSFIKLEMEVSLYIERRKLNKEIGFVIWSIRNIINEIII